MENKLPFSVVFHGHVAAIGSAALSRVVGFADVNKVHIKGGNVAHMHQYSTAYFLGRTSYNGTLCRGCFLF